MLWVKFGSVLIFVIVVILATLGGRAFFEYFDVSVHKKKAEIVQTPSAVNSSGNEHQRKSTEPSEHANDSSNRDGDWSEFN